MKRIDLLALGSLAFDDLLTIEDFPQPDQKIRARSRTKRVGGLAGGALLAAVKCGGTAAYGGRLGTDEASMSVQRALAENGIDLSLCSTDSSSGVVQSVIIAATRSGTRNVFSFRHGETGAHPELPPVDACDRFNVLLVDHHGISGQLRMARHFQKTGRPVVCDIERNDDPNTLTLLRSCSHILLPEPFALRIARTDSPKHALQHLRSIHPEAELCLITQGSRGGVFSLRNAPHDSHHRFVPPRTVVDCDTTGCGDFFHGAFCVGLSQGLSIDACIAYAAEHTAAALAERDASRF